MAEQGKGACRVPAMRLPEEAELGQLSEEMGLHCSAEELTAFKGLMKAFTKDMTVVTELCAPAPPVKYPRTPGYKPRPEENPNNAWAWRCQVRGAAGGLLAGKTVGVKDNICLAGVPMMNGSRVLEGFIPQTDATAVTRILDAGGCILGKTNCEDLCFSGSSWTCANGPVTNPHDVTRSAGGSSSGSAVAVQTGDVDMALGGDQGGSIRIPASWTGIVGLKPTFGLVPYTGAMAIDVTLDHVGPMARTVQDCALLLEVIAGYDEGRDPRQRPDLVVPSYSTKLKENVRGKKVALVTEGFDLCREEDVKAVVRKAAQRLTEAGVEVSEISLPLHKEGHAIWASVAIQGAYNCMIEGNGGGYFWKGVYNEQLMETARRGYATRQADMASPLKYTCLLGEYLNRHYGNSFYARGQNLGLVLTAAYDKALQQVDALIMPTLPTKAPKFPTAETSMEDKLSHTFGMLANTAPFDSTGHPALTVPVGFSEGLPVGMMLIGRHHDDLTLLQLGHAFEKIHDKGN